ncbi:hypothetical protein, partial [Streptomyces poriferorum]|uniref:hypothetical protein n=1 Tax=Streptomyces poriferorum TaxID=2798799 RepID=UPI001C5EEE96
MSDVPWERCLTGEAGVHADTDPAKRFVKRFVKRQELFPRLPHARTDRPRSGRGRVSSVLEQAVLPSRIHTGQRGLPVPRPGLSTG